MIGKTLGHYEILEPLGAGGMGEVYRARDTKLERDVAIKVLPEDFATDQDRLARFEREAKLLASLNHANIAAIYGLEDSDGLRFIAMELVEGETLAERIGRSGRIGVDDALDIAGQIAEALEAAHENGVIHRDLKPANVKITMNGKVKVLDFGLAKAWEAEGTSAEGSADVSHSPTMTAATRSGVIMGTASYMSPEQARGKPVDKRTDIWAFGCVLYEMLVGKIAFTGETVTDILAAVVKEDADWDSLPPDTPLLVKSLLRRCMQKDPNRRLHDIADARIEIQEVGVPGYASDEVPATTHSLLRAAAGRLAFAVITIAGASGLAGYWIGVGVGGGESVESGDTPFATHLEINLDEHAALALNGVASSVGFDSTQIALSPDGTKLVYVGKSGDETLLYLRDLNSVEIEPIQGSEDAIHGFFSPDGRSVGFLTNDEVKKVELQSGNVLTLCDAERPVFGTWTETGIFFANREAASVWRTDPVPGSCVEVVPPRAGHTFGEVLPDGSWVFATFRAGGISADYGELRLVSVATGEAKTLLPNGYGGRFVEPGHVLYQQSDNLFAVAFDVGGLEVIGDAELVAGGVRTNSVYPYPQVAVSQSGLIAYVPGGDAAVAGIAWVDRNDEASFLPLEERVYGALDVSRDNRKIAVHVAGNRDYILVYDADRNESSRIDVEGSAGWPALSPDGDRVAFTEFGRDEPYRLKVVGTDPGARQQLLVESETRLTASSWTPDSREVGFYEYTGLVRVAFVTNTTGGAPAEPRYMDFDGGVFDMSPDGRWLAYNAGGEFFLRSYPDGGTVHRLPVELAIEPQWCLRCGEIFVRTGRQWFATPLRFDPEFDYETPRLAFETDFNDSPGPSWALSADGQRILVVKRTVDMPLSRIRVMSNWMETLARGDQRPMP